MDATILVTGATGRVGGQVAQQLAGTGARVRALARDPARVTDGGPVAGDLTRPDTLGPALSGAEAAFLVFPSVAGDSAAAALVDALTAAVPRVVYLSAVQELGAEFPPGLVEAIIAGQGAFVAAPEAMTREVEELTGRPARTFAEWARDHAADFR